MTRLIPALFAATDEQLMWRVKMQDEPEAFARLVVRWEKPIQHLCARLTGDIHRAEDLAQTTFARVFAERARWEPTAKFSTYLWRIALNLCHDEMRKVVRRSECSLDVLGEDSSEQPACFAADWPQPDQQAEMSERGERVRNALLQLPPHYRAVVVLRHYQQLKFHEIAEVLGIPEGTVKSRMAEALTQLHRRLRPLTEDLPCTLKTRTPELRAL